MRKLSKQKTLAVNDDGWHELNRKMTLIKMLQNQRNNMDVEFFRKQEGMLTSEEQAEVDELKNEVMEKALQKFGK